MSNLIFSDKGWDDYLYWQFGDKSMIRKINELLKDIQRNGDIFILSLKGHYED